MKAAFTVLFVLQSVRISLEENKRPKLCRIQNCRDAYAECYNFYSLYCCVCPPGYYGGGGERCTDKRVPDRFIRLTGTISTKLSTDAYESSYAISHETVMISGPPLGQTAIYEVPSSGPAHNLLHLIQPIFHYINGLTSFPVANSRIYNIYSLTGGFSNPVSLNLKVSYRRIGNLAIDIVILRSVSDAYYFEGTMNINVTSLGAFNVPKEVYVEKLRQKRTISYSKTEKGVLRYKREQLELRTKSGCPSKSIQVAVTGKIRVKVDNTSCLLENNSLVEQNRDVFVIHFGSKGFCNTYYNQSTSFGALYCLDYPVLQSHLSLFTEAEGVRKPRKFKTNDDEEYADEETAG